MKKVTLKALQEMLKKTLFLRAYLNIFNNKKNSDDKSQRVIVSMFRYQVELTIAYDIKKVYINFYGTLDSFDAQEWLTIAKDLQALCFVGK